MYNYDKMNAKTIIAIGGGELRLRETLPIDGYICDIARERAGDRRAVALFVGTASRDCMPYYNTFHKIYTGVYGLKTDCALTVTVDTDREKLQGKFDKADVVYVGGGDTVYMLKKWRETGLYDMILSAYERGAVICGLSAGAICWFENMYTDGFLTEVVSDKYEIAPALGLLNGGACPHFDDRREDFTAAYEKDDDKHAWYCIENRAALHFEDGKPIGGISCGGKCYSASKDDGKVVFKEIFTKELR